MPYVITEVDHRCWPAEAKVEKKLKAFGLSVARIKKVLRAYSRPDPARPGKGFQKDIHDTLPKYMSSRLGNRLQSKNFLRYSTELDLKADLALGHSNTGPRMFVEIEFRPNFEKDLVKFKIGANAGTLAVAILIMTIDRKCVNLGYTTMPEFASTKRVIDEFKPAYPLLLLGFRGELCRM